MSPLAAAIPSPAPTSRQLLRLVMHGAAGRMGQRIIACAAAEPEQWKLVAAIDRAGHPLAGSDAGTLAGVAAEFGVIMLLYLKHAWTERQENGQTSTQALLEAIQEGAVLRVRPKAMTVAVILAGLLPIMWSDGTGSEVMQRIAAPMVGGMITAPLLSLFVVPAVYLLLRRRGSGQSIPQPPSHDKVSR
jgi:Cu(I)/Ag(I) efflux system membrane protein CusA/SilA